ncbi:MAG TPA: triphosphoribosyl-dephospho-CoA synthase [Rhizobacter sp.]|nr:triphosphoribosyl-dephospho-CoA synthase [Rhizobacter sp.]
MSAASHAAVDRAQASFLCACTLDVAVRKPGNVSRHSAGHRMQAAMFTAAAQAAAEPLFRAGAGVGERVEAAVEASWSVAHCNTNLGILLLCAPLAVAVERFPDAPLRDALAEVLAGLSLADAEHAFRAIARANPGGLGDAPAEDVRQAPSVDLRTAMALSAGHDLIARQYRDGYADLFERALPALGEGFINPAQASCEWPDAATTAAVQRLYVELLSSFPDSHIVRKHGEAVAQTVMASAQAWRGVADLDASPGFAAWDESLKAQGINPGTSADLTVATLMIAGLRA